MALESKNFDIIEAAEYKKWLVEMREEIDRIQEYRVQGFYSEYPKINKTLEKLAFDPMFVKVQARHLESIENWRKLYARGSRVITDLELKDALSQYRLYHLDLSINIPSEHNPTHY